MQESRRARVLATARRAAYERRIRAGALAAGALASLAFAPAAGAAVKGDRVLEVAHGRDLVIAQNYPANEELVLEVVRDGVVIATTNETHYKTDDEGFLEVNHVGVVDCFDGGTAPDIRPGDMIRATVGDAVESTDIDTMVVQNVTYDGAPVERTVTREIPAEVDPLTGAEIVPASTVTEGTGIFEVRGTALAADNVTPLAGEIEVRLNHPARATWDATNRRDWRVAVEAGPDGRYVAEFDTTASERDRAAIEDAEMAALWLGSTSELSGYDGPGSPCNPAPNAGITKVTPRVVNATTASIRIEGFAPADAVVEVGDVTVPVSAAGGWSHELPTAGLADGPLTITVKINGVPESRTVMVDRTAPAAPTASLQSGDHELPQTIHLGGEGIRYTTDGSDPTAASTSYDGGINVTSDLTIKAVSVDPAGNVSPVATFSYTKRPAPPVVLPKPETVVVEKPVEVIREVVTPAPVVVPAAKAPKFDRVSGPRRVTLAKARKGVRILVDTKATSLRATAGKGAKTTVRARTGKGYTVLVKATRKRTYRITLALPDGPSRVVVLTVR